MNIFKKKRNELEEDWKPSGSFIKKPVKGWIHPDHLLQSTGAVYQTHYIGAVKIIESMRTVPFDQRGGIVREAIFRCCQASELFNFKKKKVSLTHGIIGDCFLDHCGENTTTSFSKSSIKTTSLKDGQQLFNHSVENISFASIGEDEYRNMIGYISKDPKYFRACFVFECDSGLAEDVILTIGQAFELKYKEYLNSNPVIQPVVGRFTDPDFDSSRTNDPIFNVPRPSQRTDANKNTLLDDLDNGNTSYSQLFNVANKKPNTGFGYDTLRRNENSLIASDYDNPGTGLNFATGASYGNNHTEYATVYDNPIASASVRQKLQERSKTQSIDNDYDDPENNVCESPRDIAGNWGFETEDTYLRAVDVKKQVPPPKKPLYREISASSIHSESPYSSPKDKAVLALLREVWFHGAIARNEAENLLKKDGDFLIRESTTSSGQYVLTGMKDGQYRHLLLIDPQGKVRTRDHSFESVTDLVRFHKNNNQPIRSGTSAVYLLHEVPRTSVRQHSDSFNI